MKSKRIAILVLTVVVCAHGSDALAATKYWKDGVASGNWNVSNNWSAVSAAGADNGGVPVAGEPVRIVHTNGVAHTVTLNTATPALGVLSIDLTGAGATTNTLSITSNFSLTAGSMNVGGYSGTGPTAGRGAVIQSAGTVTSTAGLDISVANGAGSTGTYTLSGTGALIVPQSLFVGLNGNGTFHHSGGTNTINEGAIGALDVGTFAGATGTYNLSGTGQLVSNKSVYIGDQGTGIFNHTAGTHTINGVDDLYLGWAASGNGTYTASGSASLNVGDDVTVGVSGAGTLNIQGNASVNIGDQLNIGSAGTVNLSGGTLRFNTITNPARLNYTSGTLQLAGNRALGFDAVTNHFFGTNTTIPSGKRLVVEGDTTLSAGNATINGGGLSALGMLRVGYADSAGATLNITNGATVTSGYTRIGEGAFGDNSTLVPGVVNVSGSGSTWNAADVEIGRNGRGALNITGGGMVSSTSVTMGFSNIGGDSSYDTLVVSGPGSSLTTGGDLYVGYDHEASVTIDNGGSVYVFDELRLAYNARVTIDGGTLRFNNFTRLDNGNPDDLGKFIYNAGTIQLGGNRTIGGDAVLQELYGVVPVIPAGKGLTIEFAATLSKPLTIAGGTFKANSIVIGSGGSLDFDRGVLEVNGGTITGLAQLNVPTNGEFRASGGFQQMRIAGAPGSTITATGNVILGSATAVNGFGTQGTLSVGANTVTLLDANDAVFDSLSLTTLGGGAGASPGTLSAANGLTLDFGGNITGFGTISTPNNIAKPLINNGHMTGATTQSRLILPGYVKGVGTFDNVNFTGTYSPGLSPTTAIVGSLNFASTSTLIMEIGGTTAGSGYDQILASGALSLGGVLQISLINSFVPSAGQSFNILDWGSLAGTFSSLSLPTLSGLSWNTSQLYTTGVLSVAAVGLSGDYNNNGTVDAADYVVWRKSPSTYGGSPTGYNTWRANFGQPPGSGAGTSSNAAVPEPANFVLLKLAAAGWCFRRRRDA